MITVMLHYEKLPKKTPLTVVAGVLGVGLCLSYSIVISGLVAIYALIGLLGGYFYAASSIVITGQEAMHLALLLTAAATTSVILSFLAYYMNTLSKYTYRLSRILWIPTVITALYVWWQHSSPVFTHHISWPAVLATLCIVPLGGILPALFLSTKAARTLHNR